MKIHGSDNKKNNKKILLAVMLSAGLFIGWGSVVELVTEAPLVDLKILEVDSIGADGTNARPESGNTDEELSDTSSSAFIPAINLEDKVTKVYKIRIRGKKIYFDEQLCDNLQELSKKINASRLNKDSKVRLVDDYADAKVYKEVQKLIDGKYDLTIEMTN